jgi:hypothetical protein
VCAIAVQTYAFVISGHDDCLLQNCLRQDMYGSDETKCTSRCSAIWTRVLELSVKI